MAFEAFADTIVNRAWLCTIDEVCALCRCSQRYFAERLRAHPELKAAWDEGRLLGQHSLRRRQLEIAYGDSPQAATMLIHLGKTILGQSETRRHELSGAGGGPLRYSHIRRTIVDPQKPEGEQETDVTSYCDDAETSR